MKDAEKTKEELITELEGLRERIAGLEARENDFKQAVKLLKATEDIYRFLVESTDDSIYLVDRDYKYIYMNKKHKSRMGFTEDLYIGRAYGEFHTGEEADLFILRIDEVFEKGDPLQKEYKSRRDGRYFLQTLSPVRGPDGKIMAVSVISKNITDLKQLEEKLLSQSLTDELTGLYNRRGFFALAEQQLKLANRSKAGVCLLYADLDGLKDINDTYGHQEGDVALIDTATMFKKNYRDSDIIARIGGDEFVVIPVGTSKDHMNIIIARFNNMLSAHNAQREGTYRLSMSVGIACYDPHAPCSLSELLSQADQMMYKEKRQKGKSKTC